MTTELIEFAKQYSRLLYVVNIFTKVIPRSFRPSFLFSLVRYLNPFQIYSKKIRTGINLALPQCHSIHVWQNWLDSHFRFLLDFFNYQKIDKKWLREELSCADQHTLGALCESGGLVLTYHTHHQNTLCCALGLMGVKISAVAASPHDSPLFSYIGKWAVKVNADSAKHFNGGSYIFTNNIRRLLNTVQKCFTSGDVVVSLCDFHQPKGENSIEVRLFNRFISPPTGVIEMALKNGVPIFLALLAPSNKELSLRITQLVKPTDLTVVVNQYFEFLESNICANPACWQGWEWFEDLPKIS